jgi:cobalt-zinc-cadmium efflux system outer membrane protein
MRFVVLVCLAACALAADTRVVFAQGVTAVQRLTEADAIARMMASDPRIQAWRAGIDEARATQAERTLWPNPVVAYSRESVANVDETFVLGRQEFPVSGRLRHLHAAGRLAVESAQARTTFQIRHLQADLRRAFVSLLVVQEREATLRRSVGELRQLVELLRAREQAGEGSRYDRLRGQRALADLEVEQDAAAILRARAQADLASFLGPGMTPDSLIAIGALQQIPPLPVEDLVQQALMSRGDYQSIDRIAAQYEAERQAAAALRVPSPSIGYGVKRSRTDAGATRGSQLTLEVDVPLFNRGQSAVALAMAQAARASAERAFLRLQVETDVRAAHAVAGLEQARAIRYEQSLVETAEPLDTIARAAYQEGELGILELLDAHGQLREARLRVIDLNAAGRLAAIELDRATGLEIRP